METKYYVAKLQEEFSKKQRKNSAFSLRAFSKHLDLPSAVVSEIFSLKRGLPIKHAEKVASKLELSPLERKRFLESVYMKKVALRNLALKKVSKEDYETLDNEKNYAILSEWEYFAVLSLIKTANFEAKSEWISSRLNISTIRAKVVWKNLLDSNLIKKGEDGVFKRSSKILTSTFDVSSQAIRQGHKEAMEIGIEKIDTIPIKDRFYSSSTIAINKKKLGEAKDLVREFREKLTYLLEEKNADEVYQFAFQLYPLTKLDQ